VRACPDRNHGFGRSFGTNFSAAFETHAMHAQQSA
jgi:hypothetical protein